MSIYSQLPDTNDIQQARTVSEQQSQVSTWSVPVPAVCSTLGGVSHSAALVLAGQVQGGRQEGGVQLPLLHAARDAGHSSRQGGV